MARNFARIVATIAAASCTAIAAGVAPAQASEGTCNLVLSVPNSEPRYVFPAAESAARAWEAAVPGLTITVNRVDYKPTVTAVNISTPEGTDIIIAHVPSKEFSAIAKQAGLPSYANAMAGPLYGGLAIRSTNSAPNLISHELGHILGAGHNKSRKSTMYPVVTGMRGQSITAEDAAQASSALASCWPLAANR